MTMKVYQYPKCSTCRKALAWLKSHDVAFESIDIVSAPPNVETLRRVLAKSGVPAKKLFNTSGEVYRQEGYRERLEKMTEAEAWPL
jgi:arsenate reductase (glutaredoxin)